MQIHGIQFDVLKNNPKKNVDYIIQQIKIQANDNTQIFVTPECGLTGYVCANREELCKLSLKTDNDHFRQLTQTCHQTNSHLLVGFLEEAGENYYNSVAYINGNGINSIYRKIHLPHLGADRFVSPGNKFEIIKVGHLKIGILICYDFNFPEAFATLVYTGVDLVIVPTNWPVGCESMSTFLAQARAFDHQTPVMIVNRTGSEGSFKFIGGSKFVSRTGRILTQLNEEEGLLSLNFEAHKSNTRLVIIPNEYEIDFYQDRRPELYKLPNS